MLVPDAIRKCVCFVGLERADTQMRFVGTAFFLGRPIPGSTTSTFTYTVTAKHLIEGIKKRGLDRVHLRVNGVDGTSGSLPTNAADWHLQIGEIEIRRRRGYRATLVAQSRDFESLYQLAVHILSDIVFEVLYLLTNAANRVFDV